MTNIVQVEIKKFLAHALAPFYGKYVDEHGNPAPSKRTKHWAFSLHNSKKNTHLTFRSIREKGQYSTDPVSIEFLEGNTYKYLATLYPSGDIYWAQHNHAPVTTHEKLCRDTLEWIKEACLWGFETPDHIKLLAESRCARCRRELTNPTSIEWFFGPSCRKVLFPKKKAESSKTAT